MNGYQKRIVAVTGCSENEAEESEEIMHTEIFHSTLDWQSRRIFDKAAKLAVAVLRGQPVPIAVAKAIESGRAVKL